MSYEFASLFNIRFMFFLFYLSRTLHFYFKFDFNVEINIFFDFAAFSKTF